MFFFIFNIYKKIYFYIFLKLIYIFENKIKSKRRFTKVYKIKCSIHIRIFRIFVKCRRFEQKKALFYFWWYSHLISSCVFDDVMPISFWAWQVTVAPLRLRMTSFISNIDCRSPSSCWSLTFQAKELIGGFASPSQKTLIVSPSRYDNDGVDTVISGLA